jgi:hypothetical protein
MANCNILRMYVISKRLRGGASPAEEVTTALYLILDGFVFQCASLSSVVHARACQMAHFSREALEALERSSSWDPFEGTVSKSDRACVCLPLPLFRRARSRLHHSDGSRLRRAAAVHIGQSVPG